MSQMRLYTQQCGLPQEVVLSWHDKGRQVRYTNGRGSKIEQLHRKPHEAFDVFKVEIGWMHLSMQ